MDDQGELERSCSVLEGALLNYLGNPPGFPKNLINHSGLQDSLRTASELLDSLGNPNSKSIQDYSINEANISPKMVHHLGGTSSAERSKTLQKTIEKSSNIVAKMLQKIKVWRGAGRPLEASWGGSGRLGVSWGHLGASWDRFGRGSMRLGTLLGRLGDAVRRFEHHFGGVLGGCMGSLRAPWSVPGPPRNICNPFSYQIGSLPPLIFVFTWIFFKVGYVKEAPVLQK